MSLVITGAGGQLGRRTAELLLDHVEPHDVVLVSRRPDELADLAARGAQTRHGDFDDPTSLAAAFAGGERLLLISTDAVGEGRSAYVSREDCAAVAAAEIVASFGTAIRGHHLDQLSTTVEELTGRPPLTVAEVLKRGLW